MSKTVKAEEPEETSDFPMSREEVLAQMVSRLISSVTNLVSKTLFLQNLLLLAGVVLYLTAQEIS